MPWFINEAEVERRGAVHLLSPCENFPFAQMALQQLRSGAEPEEAGRMLASFLNEQAKCCQIERNNWKGLMESHWANPVQEQLKKAQNALDEQTKRAERAEKSEQELRTILERERTFYPEQVRELKQRVAELNRLVASQHKRLEELTGPENPPE
jgi:hypothetical protein